MSTSVSVTIPYAQKLVRFNKTKWLKFGVVLWKNKDYVATEYGDGIHIKVEISSNLFTVVKPTDIFISPNNDLWQIVMFGAPIIDAA